MKNNHPNDQEQQSSTQQHKHHIQQHNTTGVKYLPVSFCFLFGVCLVSCKIHIKKTYTDKSNIPHTTYDESGNDSNNNIATPIISTPEETRQYSLRSQINKKPAKLPPQYNHQQPTKPAPPIPLHQNEYHLPMHNHQL